MIDPPAPTNGTCAQCGNPRPTSRDVRRYAGEQIDTDPFCSTQCCRAWHGTELPPPPKPPGRTPGPRRHATESGYTDGCRCADCTNAATAARNKRRRQGAHA